MGAAEAGHAQVYDRRRKGIRNQMSKELYE